MRGILKLVALISAAAMLSLLSSEKAEAQCSTNLAEVNDPTHPCKFIQVLEVERRDSSWLLFGRRSRKLFNGSKLVDAQSTLHIGYVHAPSLPPGLSVGIEAFLRHDNKEVPIQVPGYSTVGEEKKRAELRFISSRDIVDRVALLLASKASIDTALVSALKEHDKASNVDKVRDSAVALLKRSQDSVERLVRDSAALERVLARRKDDSTRAGGDSSLRDPSLTAIADTLQKKRAILFELSLKAAEATNTRELIQKTDSATLYALLSLIKGQYQAKAVVKSLRDPVNRNLLAIMGAVSGTPLEALTSDLATLQRSFDELDSVRANVDAKVLRPLLIQHARSISVAVGDLSRNYDRYNPGNPDYRAVISSLLPSTDIGLASNNAAAGDRIILRITTVDLHEHRRVTDFAVDVTDYGIVRRITDSFLFLSREVPRSVESEMIRKRVNAYVGKKGLERDLLSPVIQVPVRSRMAPTAGVTYGWTWHPRESNSWKRELGRALHPGWGVNVSFPSYRTRQVALTLPDTVLDSAVIARVEPNSKESSSLGIATGGVISLFDGAFQGSVGGILNAPSRRWYWSIGLSFVGLTTAGKELYQKITDAR